MDHAFVDDGRMMVLPEPLVSSLRCRFLPAFVWVSLDRCLCNGCAPDAETICVYKYTYGLGA